MLPAAANLAGGALEHPPARLALAQDPVAVGAARLLYRAQPLALDLRFALQAEERFQVGAVAGDERRRGPRHVADVIEAPGEVGRIVAGEHRAQRLRGGERLARQQHALYRGLALGERALEELAPLRKLRDLHLELSAFQLQRGQRAIGVRDRALRVAQRIARFAALGFLPVELARERFDAAAQRAQCLLARRRLRGEGRGGQREQERARQTFALPCAETAATRRATSAASPR